MKKRLLLITLMVALFVCVLALGISAQGATTDEFGTAETVEGIPVDLTDTTSRVVLKGADGLYRTFPSAYIYFKTGAGNWGWRGEAKCSFDALNTALGLTEGNAYTIDSVIRIEFPDDLKYIEGYGGKVNLKEVYFSPNSQMTNMRPFGNGCGLEKITMPPLQTSYPEFLFHTSPNLTTVIFHENGKATSLPKEMFKACTALEEVTIPEGVTSVGGSFFAGCTALKRVHLPSTLTNVGTIFSGLTTLEYVNTEYLTSYTMRAFQGCTSLDGIVINSAVTTIPNDFCKGCSSLTSIVIPASVTEIKGYAFDGCSKLASITNYAEGITSLGGNAFSGCPITEFNMPDSLTEIGQYCFNGAQFTEIDIPNTVSSIGQGAFQGCTKLTFLRFPESLTQIPHDSLKGTTESNITIVVPKGCTSIYSQYSLQNTGVQRIIFTGTADSAFVASVQEKASSYVSKIEYANHCEYYYDNVHDAPYKYVFTSYLEECYTEGVCSRCGITNHGETYDAIVSFLGIAIKMDGTATTAGYALNDDSLAVYVSEGYTFNYGVVGYIPTQEQGNSYSPLTIGENGVEAIDKQYTIHADISGEYASVDFIIKGFPQEAVSLIMCMYVYNGTDIVYICGTSALSYEQVGTAYAVTVDVASNSVTKA